jgi:hypothetical protein
MTLTQQQKGASKSSPSNGLLITQSKLDSTTANSNDLQHLPTPLIESEVWDLVTKLFIHEPGMAEVFAHLLFGLRKAIASGPGEQARAIAALGDGIRATYIYTEENKLAVDLYEMYLTYDLSPRDEPKRVLANAIERASVRTNGHASEPKLLVAKAS